MRQRIDNGTWFETDSATVFEEDRYWNGQNHISKATGSQWEHEKLYRTVKGAWILHAWSQWQGSSESWTSIDSEEAYAWLLKNDHQKEVPEEHLATLEV